MTNKDTIKLLGVELAWAFLGKVNDKGNYASGKYEVTVIMSPEQAAKFKEAGIADRQKVKPAKDHDGKYQITLKSKLEPFVYDRTGKPLTTEEKNKIGNGTIANVEATIFEVRGSKFAGINRILIKDLKEYTGGVGAEGLMDEEADLDSSELMDD